MNDKLHPALAEHAMETELQLERERHRKTWRQLEQVRGLLGELREITSEYAWDVDLEARVDAALSQQADPVEPAPAQDEREAFKRALHSQRVFKLSSATINAAEWAWFARPAQTEQQPVARIGAVMSRKQRLFSIDILNPEFLDVGTELYATPIAQTALSTQRGES